MWWAQQEPDDPWVEDRLDPHPRSQWCLPTGGGDYLCHCGCLDVFPGLPTVQLLQQVKRAQQTGLSVCLNSNDV